MAEPLSIIGTAGALANIIEVTCKVISTLRELHKKWENAETILLDITFQLIPFKNALLEIQKWLELDTAATSHYQLTINLDETLSHCQLLVNKIETCTNAIGGNGQSPLEWKARFRVLRDSKALEGLQKTIDRQTNSLSLLLTACNCKSAREQQILLEKSNSQKVIKRMRQDSVSLLAHYDKGSVLTHGTDNLSKLSRVFDFDSTLLHSAPYEQAMRSSMKGLLRRIKAPKESLDTVNDKISIYMIRNHPHETWSTEAVDGRSDVDLLSHSNTENEMTWIHSCEFEQQPELPNSLSWSSLSSGIPSKSHINIEIENLSSIAAPNIMAGKAERPLHTSLSDHMCCIEIPGLHELDAVWTQIYELEAIEITVSKFRRDSVSLPKTTKVFDNQRILKECNVNTFLAAEVDHLRYELELYELEKQI
ncbi:hypothetical protein B0O99DRAFT_693603 [Bisporella sp. PMI_857]|nr:hypothetical protein B0O99DRAFT_693603 [Bisporella sp. PMI_857]